MKIKKNESEEDISKIAEKQIKIENLDFHVIKRQKIQSDNIKDGLND